MCLQYIQLKYDLGLTYVNTSVFEPKGAQLTVVKHHWAMKPWILGEINFKREEI